MENKAYEHLRNNQLLIEHSWPSAFCETFGIPYNKKEVVLDYEDVQITAMEEYSKYRIYSSVKEILDQ